MTGRGAVEPGAPGLCRSRAASSHTHPSRSQSTPTRGQWQPRTATGTPPYILIIHAMSSCTRMTPAPESDGLCTIQASCKLSD